MLIAKEKPAVMAWFVPIWRTPLERSVRAFALAFPLWRQLNFIFWLMGFLVNTSLLSANASAAVVGAFAIPLLIGRRVRSDMAAATVLVGTWGACLQFRDFSRFSDLGPRKYSCSTVAMLLAPILAIRASRLFWQTGGLHLVTGVGNGFHDVIFLVAVALIFVGAFEQSGQFLPWSLSPDPSRDPKH